MTAPRSSTAFAKTTGPSAVRKSPTQAPAQSAKKPAAKRATQAGAKAAARAPFPGGSTADKQAAEALQELQFGAEALSVRIARLAQRFL